MLGKEFETWPIDSFPNMTLIIVSILVTNLDYLENGSLCFTKLSDGNMKESNRILVGLDIPTIIQKTNDQDLSDLIDLEVKRANKKKEKTKKCR